MVAWVREEEKAFGNRQRKREAEEEDKGNWGYHRKLETFQSRVD